MTSEDYEIYRTIRTKEDFFGSWKAESTKGLTEELKDRLYKKYVIKCLVLQRDDFRCQNAGCQTPESALTMHHIKHQRNGGKDRLKNCATICNTCHQAFHRAKIPLTIYGATYRTHIEKTPTINWKTLKKENRVFRRSIKNEWRVTISWELAAQLLAFLFDGRFVDEEYYFEDD